MDVGSHTMNIGGKDQCCALCPFGLTCKRFGMVWDARNVVGLMNDIFLYNIVCSVNFIIFSLGSLASPTVALSWACRTAQQGHNSHGNVTYQDGHIALLHQTNPCAIEPWGHKLQTSPSLRTQSLSVLPT